MRHTLASHGQPADGRGTTRAGAGTAALVSSLAACALLSAPAAGSDDRGWLGIYSEPVAELPAVETSAGGPAVLVGATCGLRITAVMPGSPADSGGALIGDIIVALCGQPFACPPESAQAVLKRAVDARQAGAAFPLRVLRDAVARDLARNGERADSDLWQLFWRDPAAAIAELASGDTLTAGAGMHQRVIELPVTLGLRPEARWPLPRANHEIYDEERFANPELAALVWSLADSHGVRVETQDLLARLARCHAGADPCRLECMIYAHRDPMRLEPLARAISDSLATAPSIRAWIEHAGALLVPGFVSGMPAARRLQCPGAELGTYAEEAEEEPWDAEAEQGAGPRDNAAAQAAFEELIEQICGVFGEARQWHRRAFAALDDDERAFVEKELWTLPDAFAGQVYVHIDEQPERFPVSKRLIDLGARIDYAALTEAALRLALLHDPEWVMHAGLLVYEAFADSMDQDILFDRETACGRIVIGGAHANWHRLDDVAFLFDLGGDDFYTGHAGGATGWKLPLSICIDLSGNDAYESTRPGCHGAGCLGVGGLYDLEGDDQYIGPAWNQGVGYFGIGWIHDAGGRDVYRGRSFAQGVGLFGMGCVLDQSGDDRYEGDGHVQGVGLARGIGALIDSDGDDQYYAKGLFPTGYGDAGIFEAWSQGCGQGFRTLASGGLGLLADGGGRDRLEAGNFSQGGGYYYSMGILHCRGFDDDVYIGSRYNQGFSAHQAVGVLLEEGGNDLYLARQGVAQGLAWDESVSLLVDGDGDDTYHGGAFFSHGASAHNSFCIFRDEGGTDTYDHGPGPARAGGNDYHGGVSFSLFIDEQRGFDSYSCAAAANDTLVHQPTHGFFIDGTRFGEAP